MQRRTSLKSVRVLIVPSLSPFNNGLSMELASPVLILTLDVPLSGALKAEIFPLTLYTSAGTVLLNVYDSTLHAKGQSPLQAISFQRLTLSERTCRWFAGSGLLQDRRRMHPLLRHHQRSQVRVPTSPRSTHALLTPFAATRTLKNGTRHSPPPTAVKDPLPCRSSLREPRLITSRAGKYSPRMSSGRRRRDWSTGRSVARRTLGSRSLCWIC